MKVDYVVKNASIYTSNKDSLRAQAFAVKDGKFVYVGDEKGLSDYEGEVKDMQGRFITPGMMDSHIHIAIPIGLDVRGACPVIDVDSKAAAFKYIKDYIKENPGKASYDFMLNKQALGDDDICYEELDEISTDVDICVREREGHSVWVNGPILKRNGIDDNYVDPAPGLHYAVRDKTGHLTGNLFEGCSGIALTQNYDLISDEYLESQIQIWIDYCKKVGITAVFEAGTPGDENFGARINRILCRMDKEGKLPIYIEGSYVIHMPDMIEGAIDKLIQWNKEFSSEHVKVRTLKIVLDGTTKIESACVVEPYVSGKMGGRIADEVTISKLIIRLNELGFDLHVHTVGDGASRTVLDAVELARKELGDSYNTRVTVAHLELIHDSDIDRFAKLGIITNFTPFWCGTYDLRPLGEERANKVLQLRTVYDTGALFTCSSDNTEFEDFSCWNPLLGIEVGITRLYGTNTKVPDYAKTEFPLAPESECMTMDPMLLGYTVNNAYQLHLEDKKGSIEVGKDADFLVYEEDFFKRDVAGLSQLEPVEVYFEGKRV